MSIKKDYTIVLTPKDRDKLEQHIRDHDYFSFDVESTGLNVRKDRVIGFSISGKEGVAFYYPLWSWNTEAKELLQISDFKHFKEMLLLLKQKELLMWNGSYDIRITKHDLNIDLLESLMAEGMLMAHTLMEEGPFGLKKVGVIKQREIGYNVEETADQEAIELKQNVEKNGGSTTKANYEMYKADLEVLGKYACADADITFRLCEHFYKKLEEENLVEFFFDDEVMPLYKEVTIPMEDRGVKIDLDLIEKTKESLEKDLKETEQKVVNALFTIPEVETWYYKKVNEYTEEAPKGNFAQGVAEHFSLNLPVSEKTKKYSITKKTVDSLPDSPAKQFLKGEISNLFAEDSFSIKEKIYLRKEGAKINISSKKQLSEIVFDELRIKELSKTKKGAKQFDDKMISQLEEDGYEWANLLGDYNKLVKIKGTYIDRFLDNQENGIYYFSYKQHGTISGRYGSDAQQLPRPKEEGKLSEMVLKYTNVIRKFFIAGEGRKFVDCDYESLEPHVFAHVSNEDGIRDIFKKGHDFYSTIAINTEKMTGVSADKKAENYLGKVDPAKRQAAKAYALGVPYGMTGYALGKTLDIPTKEADELVKNYLDSYPNLKSWIRVTKRKVQSEGYITSQVGRVRHLPKVKVLYRIHKEKLLDFRYRKKLEKSREKDEILEIYRDYKNGINNSINFQIQSLSSSIVNRAAIAINRYFKKNNIDAWVCGQIHDQLITNIPDSDCKKHAKAIQDMMENTTKLSIALKAPAELGENWFDAH